MHKQALIARELKKAHLDPAIPPAALWLLFYGNGLPNLKRQLVQVARAEAI